MLSLKIDNQFIALPDDTEISIEASNPIFSDAGAKTYLFEIPVESLRYIIGNADEIYGESLYDVLEGKRAAIYIDGVPFFFGVVNLEDEISIEDGKIAVSIASGNLEFAQMIGGMNCRDVELKDEIEVGWVYDSYVMNVEKNPDFRMTFFKNNLDLTFKYDFPYNIVAVRNTNILEGYPHAKYCNIRRCYGIGNKALVDSYISSNDVSGSVLKTEKASMTSSQDVLSLEYGGLNSGLCFYVLYFIECLAHKLGLSIKENCLSDIEDACRLAFVNLATKVEVIGNEERIHPTDAAEDFPGIEFTGHVDYVKHYGENIFPLIFGDSYISRRKVKATSENFPDASVSEVIEAIQGIFNVKFLLDDTGKNLLIVSVRDCLLNEGKHNIFGDISESYKIENNTKGFKMSYSSNEDDTSYNFSNYSKVEPISQYSEALRRVSSNENTVFIDTRTGNAYAVKISLEALEEGDIKQLNPSLFEVGGFSPAVYGDCSNDETTENVKLGFSPIINIDINGGDNISAAKSSDETSGDSGIENIYAFLIPEDIETPSWVEIKEERKSGSIWIYGDDGWWTSHDNVNFWASMKYFNYLGEPSYQSENKVSSYNTGLMLGIMRGPGSDSAPETFDQNFDGEGNYRVAFTAANYAFTSDSIDNCDRDFDYNGTGEGVGEDGLKGRFSLKLRASKFDKDGNPIKLYDKDGNEVEMRADRANRGLYDQFWKEYAYFTVNKKILRLTCGMEIADIINLDWTKRYKIGEWTGFIANYSFNVNKDGMSEVELEMYYL